MYNRGRNGGKLERARFTFYEKVRVVPGDPRLSAIAGELGAVLGIARSTSGEWSYAVHVYGRSLCWYILEADLRPTGEHDRRETFYSGESARVAVDAKGRGRERAGT